QVPVCGCGEQGCADASYQFRGRFSAHDVPILVEALESVPLTHTALRDKNYWRPDDRDEFTPFSEWPGSADQR
ncbi:MAG TPA: hypothetical protein VHC63_10570, partial [Acidimicrobiales bacterium]|nr:hypothetical protein [Acidimicrobiales bacterium]